MENEEKSEFGKGLVICLVKFAEHRWRWHEDKRLKEIMLREHPERGDLFKESDAVEMHFNGASDHLFEIEVPAQWQNTDIEKKVKELQHFGLEVGHGFTGKQWAEADVTFAYELCQEIAVLIDKKLELSPDKGAW